MHPIKTLCALCITLHLFTGTAEALDSWQWPIRGPVLTAYRNGADPYAAGQHRGVDIGARVGTQVVAATSGTVVYAGVAGSSGLTVAQRTSDGRFALSYLHLSSATVRRGEEVEAGEPIGAVGTSGGGSVDDPHLHFGVRDAGARHAYRDPLDFLGSPPSGDAPEPRAVPVPVAEPARPEPATAPPPPAIPSLALQPAGASVPSSPLVPGPAGAPAAAPAATTLSAGIASAFVTEPARASAVADRAPAGAAADARAEKPHHGADPAVRTHTPHAGPRTSPGSRAAGPAHPDARARAPEGGKGIDLGWLAACLGLVAAATMLGHPDRTRRAARRSGTRLAHLLRPLIGRQ